MSVDEKHLAFPKLVGGPAYGRPSAPVAPTDRPLDPDELPLTVDQTPEERALADALASRSGARTGRDSATHLAFTSGVAYVPSELTGSVPSAPKASLTPRPFTLRGFTSRIRGRA